MKFEGVNHSEFCSELKLLFVGFHAYSITLVKADVILFPVPLYMACSLWNI